jgi:dTDP-4-dehydrorhamnose 3,5-epimerase
MENSSIFIIGANGQLGTALRQQYPGARTADISELDISDSGSVAGYDWSGVSVILNAAAYTNVDGAETDEGRVIAWNVNAQAVANLVAAALKHDLTLVHLSTDYVFDGSKDPHFETEPFSPLSVYAASKAAGDIAVSLLEKHYILRTSWVIGEGKNFVRTMLELAQKGINPSVVADQVGRLTFTSELVRGIDYALTKQLPYGTYNLTNGGDSVSWAEIARAVFKEAGYENTVTDTSTEAYYAGKTGIAPRPLKSTLDLSKIEAAGFTPRSWQEDLQAYIQKELAT